MHEFTSLQDKKENYIKITEIYPWEELKALLGKIGLKGNSNLFPYAKAKIDICSLNIKEVCPLSLYALSSQINFQIRLRELFLDQYKIDLFDLSKIVEFETKERRCRISPPLVEISKRDGNKPLLVDGIHRFLSAEKMGITQVKTIVISKVPDCFPLVPLPLNWEDVRICEAVPEKKRVLRFPDAKDPYFFYRDFSLLGSSGVRQPGSK